MTFQWKMDKLSLFVPKGKEPVFTKLSDETIHDLCLDELSNSLGNNEIERVFICNTMSHLCKDASVTKYRCDIFADILNFPEMRKELVELLDKVNFLKNYGSFRKESDAAGIWDLLHRLDELKEYIWCVESIYKCLDGVDITSEGLIDLKNYVKGLYYDSGFEELKKDINNLQADTSTLKSVTLGVNLNERFEAGSVGIISINNKSFTKSNVISNFCDYLSKNEESKDDSGWDEKYTFHQVTTQNSGNLLKHLDGVGRVSAAMRNPLTLSGISAITKGETSETVMKDMDRVVSQMLNSTVKKLKVVLSKYAVISMMEIADLIPELIYYVRWAERIEQERSEGKHFAKAEVFEEGQEKRRVQAKGVYNIKLSGEIITNDIDFDEEHRIYILTGANRGGKTTITQAVGMLFMLAQGGIYIPGDEFRFDPVDCIYTHFPADEDKTMDLGRLGEECKRFKEIYEVATKDSLLLLNETFSTTSFEEGYYIAVDAIRALRIKGIRTIYNTHMHKLGREASGFNEEAGDGKVVSIITETNEGIRSYRIKIAAPEGTSCANDIAKKYGVTFEQLVNH